MHIFPYHDEAIAVFNNISTQATFLLHAGPPTQRSLEGRKLSPWIPPAPTDDPDYVTPAPNWPSHSAWRSGFAPGENVIGMTRSATALTGIPPASHGRVLGDRSTLYKYENPHLIAVLTKSHVRDANSAYESDHHQPHTRCTVYLMDSVKGTVLYNAVIPASRESLKGPRLDSACDVKMSLVENWLIYHYYDDDASGVGARGWRVVSVELYEGGANVRTRRYVLQPFAGGGY
jgi:ER membrane protein complex subunit 1